MDKEYQLQFDNKNPYQLRVGNLRVELKYGNNRKIEECILNILKQKLSKKDGGKI